MWVLLARGQPVRAALERVYGPREQEGRGAERFRKVQVRIVCFFFGLCLSELVRRLGNEIAKAGSPRLASEAGDFQEEVKPPTKGKGKGKAKKSGECYFSALREYFINSH